MEVFYYRRHTLYSIYINKDNKGEAIVKGGNYYIDESGKNIPELKGKTMVHKDGKDIVPKDGVIVIEQDLYTIDKNDPPDSRKITKLESINGRTIKDIIVRNREFQNEERELDDLYSIVIKEEEYSGHTKDYSFVKENMAPAYIHSSPFLYRDKDNKWQFVSQKLKYGNYEYKSFNLKSCYLRPIHLLVDI